MPIWFFTSSLSTGDTITWAKIFTTSGTRGMTCSVTMRMVRYFEASTSKNNTLACSIPWGLKIRPDHKCNCRQSLTPQNLPSMAKLSEAQVKPGIWKISYRMRSLKIRFSNKNCRISNLVERNGMRLSHYHPSNCTSSIISHSEIWFWVAKQGVKGAEYVTIISEARWKESSWGNLVTWPVARTYQENQKKFPNLNKH